MLKRRGIAVGVGPTIPYGVHPEALHYPGSVEVLPSTLALLIKELCVGLKKMGFRHIALLMGHDGNLPAMQLALQELLIQEDLDVMSVNWLLPHLKDQAHILPTDCMDGHGGARETSRGIASFPDLVHLREAAPYCKPVRRQSGCLLRRSPCWAARYTGRTRWVLWRITRKTARDRTATRRLRPPKRASSSTTRWRNGSPTCWCRSSGLRPKNNEEHKQGVIMAIDGTDIRVLIINGSPRKNNHTAMFAEAAAEGARSLGANTVLYDIAGKRYEHCRESCKAYHTRTGNCIIDDDLHELANEWIRADGIIYAVPVFHMGMPSAMDAIITRLGAIVFGGSGKVPRLLKVGGVIAQGNTVYGGQELVMQYVNAHLMLMNCIPITGDMPEAYIGTGSQVDNDGTIDRREKVLESAYSLGVRVTETAKILKTGKAALEGCLPEEYQYDAGKNFSPPQKAEGKK